MDSPGRQKLDRGLWITWYDLPDSGRDAYFSWLHGNYIPRLLKHPRVVWAAHYAVDTTIKPLAHLHHTDDRSVPTGNGYILLAGAEDAHAFDGLTRYKFALEVSSEDKKMLAMRIGERVNIMTEEARNDGMDVKQREHGVALSPCIQLGTFGAGTADEDELMAWYASYRMPAMATLPGAVGIRKLVSVSGWAKHGVIYEFVSKQARAENFRAHEAGDAGMAAWTKQLVPKLLHAPGSPVVAERIWPPVK